MQICSTRRSYCTYLVAGAEYGASMPILLRFHINVPTISPPSFDDIAEALARESRRGGAHPEFHVWGNASYPDSTLVEYLRDDRFAVALAALRQAIDRAGVGRYCTGGDLHLPTEPVI